MQSSPTALQTSNAKTPSASVRQRDEWWRSRVLVGAFAVLLHALTCVYYAAMAKLHHYIQHKVEATLVLGFAGTDLFGYFACVIAASVLLAIVHGASVCVYCWRARPRRGDRRVSSEATTEASTRSSQRVLSRSSSAIEAVSASITRWDHRLERIFGAGSYELLVFVEIGLQAFQAYKLSHLIATPWINRLMVLVIVVNCWFMPIVSLVLRKKASSFVKVVHLALDSLMEIVYGMAIPLAIFYPYYRDANHIMFDAPYVNFYHDTWFINAIAENRQLYVTSWLDFCSKMAPGVSLFARLYTLQAHQAEHEVRTRTASVLVVVPQGQSRQNVKKRLVHGIMFFFGLGVLMAHLAANTVSFTGRNPGCLLEMMPFGSTQYTCAVLEVSCTQKHIAGTKSELSDALTSFDASSVRGLIFSHCGALSMPPRLKAFPNLILIKIHNCSIEEWGEDAAMTAQAHPVFQTLYITTTNMSRIPDGIMSPDFPPLFSDIEICESNLTELPIDVQEKWSTLVFLFVELSPGITELPPALLHADAMIPYLSLSSNGISALPDDLFVGHEYTVLLLAGNPLEKLPERIGSAPAMVEFSIAFTGIADLPASWLVADDENVQVAAASGFVMFAASTPLCDALLDGNPPNGNLLRLSWLPVRCSENFPRYAYPLELEKQWRQANRV